ncbi:uncharacterized protein WM294_001664 [Sarcoramphus papa]
MAAAPTAAPQAVPARDAPSGPAQQPAIPFQPNHCCSSTAYSELQCLDFAPAVFRGRLPLSCRPRRTTRYLRNLPGSQDQGLGRALPCAPYNSQPSKAVPEDLRIRLCCQNVAKSKIKMKSKHPKLRRSKERAFDPLFSILRAVFLPEDSATAISPRDPLRRSRSPFPCFTRCKEVS